MKENIDRLGRSILHQIVQYDLYECFEFVNFELADYFKKDFNGDTAIDYTYIYNSKNCLKYILDKFDISNLVKEIQTSNINYIEKIVI
jgi:hypothetical protein